MENFKTKMVQKLYDNLYTMIQTSLNINLPACWGSETCETSLSFVLTRPVRCLTLLPCMHIRSLLVMLLAGGVSSFRLTLKPGFFLRSPYALFSTASSSPSLVESLFQPAPSPSPKLLFVTGKGGVGKTTTSASLGLLLSSIDPPLASPSPLSNVLIVSTDPAHSLFDAFALPQPEPSSTLNLHQITSPLVSPSTNLYLANLDATSSQEGLNSLTDTMIGKLNVDSISQDFGVSKDLLITFGADTIINDIREAITPADGQATLLPPGSDEILSVLSLLSAKTSDGRPFDLIITDCAPSGHTIRMLDGPAFIDSSLGKLLKFRSSINGVFDKIRAMGGGNDQRSNAELTVGDLVDKIDEVQKRVKAFTKMVAEGEIGFVVVGIPTKLSLDETKRTVDDINKLSEAGGVVKNVVVNQVLPEGDVGPFIERRVRSQGRQIDTLKQAVKEKGIKVKTVPYIDTEIVGVAGLSYFGNTFVMGDAVMDDLASKSAQQKVIVFGGKGGVGKTTTSSSVAVSLASKGNKVAIVSTDPAHSLGDALGEKLTGIKEGVDLTSQLLAASDGSKLVAYEVDTKGAIEEFRSALGDLTPPKGLEGASSSLGDIVDVLENLPPGSDEVIALSQLVTLLKKGGFDYIIIDTAPTGHALRLLTFPRFIDSLIERVVKVSEKVLPTLRMLGGSGASLSDEDIEKAKMKLLGFQLKMFELDEMFMDEENCEFVVVTIPTDLAVKESLRLINELENGEVKIRCERVVVNQVANSDGSRLDSFVEGVRRGQSRQIGDYEKWAEENGVQLTKIELLDEEPKSEYGLAALWGKLSGK